MRAELDELLVGVDPESDALRAVVGTVVQLPDPLGPGRAE